MRIIKTIFLIFITLLIILIDFPENYKIKLSVAKKNFEYTINPLSLNFSIFGTLIKRDFKTRLGLDLKGGSHLVFEADTKNIKAEDLVYASNSSRDIIEKRVNFFGVSEPTVSTIKSGSKYRISVDLPGIDKVDEAIALIGKTAQLTFREEEMIDPKIATTTPVLDRLTKDTGLTGKHIKKANITFDSQSGKPQVALVFSNEGSKIFAQVTKRNIGKPVAIIVDNFIVRNVIP